MRTVLTIRNSFLKKYPQMNRDIAEAVAILMLSEKELLNDCEPRNPELPQNFKTEWAKTLASSVITRAEEILSKATPRN